MIPKKGLILNGGGYMKKLRTMLLGTFLVLSLTACGSSQTAGTPAETSAAASSETSEAPQQDSGKETASTCQFDCTEEEQVVENLVFEEDVTVGGENGQITFAGCEFKGDLILTANEGTRVILEDSSVDGQCVFRNETKESTMEWSFPKFLVDSPVDIVCTDCIGSVIAFGDFEVTFNGESYAMKDATLYFDLNDPEAGFVPYTGQEASYFCVAQWWENEEKVLMVECEYDPSL